MTDLSLKAAILCSVLLVPGTLLAQTTTATDTAASTEETAGLMTPEELQTLVGPVALYPDTLLIQILVAATFPFDVMKADRVLKDNPGKTPEELKPLIAIQAWDESVAVLATAFPEVLTEMAVHVDWTETMGNAMLAQSDDLLAAVQTMRNQAINAGALISGEEQTVSVDDGAVIVQPTDPQVVYVPQYDSQTVYVQDNSNQALTNTLLFFGTAILINRIYHNNNHWHGYWGCRNCAGWGGKPIYRDPRVNIGRGGNVNIGNEINIGGGGDRGPGGSWKPEPKRQQEARNKISNKRGPDGATRMPVNRPDSRGDQMRQQLSTQSGARDISRDRGNQPGANRPSTRQGSSNRDAIARTGQRPSNASPPVRKPSTKPAARQPAARAPSNRQSSAMRQRAPAKQSRAASSRGRSGGGGKRGRR